MELKVPTGALQNKCLSVFFIIVGTTKRELLQTTFADPQFQGVFLCNRFFPKVVEMLNSQKI